MFDKLLSFWLIAWIYDHNKERKSVLLLFKCQEEFLCALLSLHIRFIYLGKGYLKCYFEARDEVIYHLLSSVYAGEKGEIATNNN